MGDQRIGTGKLTAAPACSGRRWAGGRGGVRPDDVAGTVAGPPFAAAQALQEFGTMQPLSGAARDYRQDRHWSGVQMGRSTASTGRAASTAGRSKLFIVDYESKPDVGRRKAEKLVRRRRYRRPCRRCPLQCMALACMPVWEEYKIVNMVGVCLDTDDDHHQVQPLQPSGPFDYARRRRVAFAPYLVNKLRAKNGHIAYAGLRLGPIEPRDAYAERKSRNWAGEGRRQPPEFRSAPPT